ncbi:MAG: FtsK/SpoIIIE domain-containing protein [Desulfovibrionaceae bacterium]
MSGLSIQQILSSRYRTSKVADGFNDEMMNALGLSTRANVARLAIGRSLALGALPNDTSLDAKGREIPGTSLFTQEDVPLWVGLLTTHARMYGQPPIESMETFRMAVRGHWHRGVKLLIDDWKAHDEDFDRFLETLINRRAELPDTPPGMDEEEPSQLVQVESPQDISTRLVKAVADIGVRVEVKGFTHGPRVTRYKIFLPDINQLDKLKRGLERLSMVLGLQQAMPSLSRGDETRTMFLDIPRPKDTWHPIGVNLLEKWIRNADTDKNKLIIYPGVDILGEPFSFDLADAPHLLVAGATGQGKSVCLHAIILSLMLQHTSENIQLALLDPKQVEFSVYKGSKYLYGGDVAVGVEQARERFMELVSEMDHRYSQLNDMGVTNLVEARAKGAQLPYIVVFIEELADLVMQDRDLEGSIVRLAQLARAAGIHLVMATQRPDSKTLSGLIRSNVPARIALTVQKNTESSIILDETGAENLLGAGDMLIKTTSLQTTRAHGVFISRKDIESMVS